MRSTPPSRQPSPQSGFEVDHPTRWTTTLSSKLNLPHEINFRASDGDGGCLGWWQDPEAVLHDSMCAARHTPSVRIVCCTTSRSGHHSTQPPSVQVLPPPQTATVSTARHTSSVRTVCCTPPRGLATSRWPTSRSGHAQTTPVTVGGQPSSPSSAFQRFILHPRQPPSKQRVQHATQLPPEQYAVLPPGLDTSSDSWVDGVFFRQHGLGAQI